MELVISKMEVVARAAGLSTAVQFMLHLIGLHLPLRELFEHVLGKKHLVK